MAVLKNKTQGRYVIIGMAPMQDVTLSVKERGLLFTIMALPDNWEFSIAGLSKILPDGKESLGNIIISLEEKGYLTRTQSRAEGGAFGKNIIEVHENPVKKIAEIKDKKSGQNPVTENPATVNPFTDNPSTGNPAQYNTNKSNIQKIYSSINPSLQEYEDARADIKDRISYDTLVFDYQDRIDTIDLITEIMITVATSDQEYFRIGKEKKPTEVVRSQFAKIGMFHVQYVLGCLESAGKIKNPTAYLLTTLYRAALTMDMHIDNHVKNDVFPKEAHDE